MLCYLLICHLRLKNILSHYCLLITTASAHTLHIDLEILSFAWDSFLRTWMDCFDESMVSVTWRVNGSSSDLNKGPYYLRVRQGFQHRLFVFLHNGWIYPLFSCQVRHQDQTLNSRFAWLRTELVHRTTVIAFTYPEKDIYTNFELLKQLYLSQNVRISGMATHTDLHNKDKSCYPPGMVEIQVLWGAHVQLMWQEDAILFLVTMAYIIVYLQRHPTFT